jgi:ATP-binding cassette subfamily C (CFTR/MRP) protein 1
MSTKNFKSRTFARLNFRFQKIYPEHFAGLLSRITFWWLNPLILTGYKRDLTKEDMWEIDESESSRNLTDKLEKKWNKVAQA